MIGAILALTAAHIAASDVCFLVARRLLRGVQRPSSLRIFLLTRGLGPIAIASTSYAALVFLPGRGRWFYICLLGALFLSAAVICRNEWPQLARAYVGTGTWARERLRRGGLPLGVAGTFALLGVVLGIWLPIVEHDALAAAIESRIAARDASFGNYLAIVEPDPETGYFMETFRTPSLQSLYVFYSWVAGMPHLDLLIRTTSPIFALHCLLLVLMATLRHHSFRVAGWSAVLLATTPMFFYMSYNNGIDTTRLYIAFVALLWIVELAATGSFRVAVVSGGVSGLALFCHLLSVPALFGGGLGFLLQGKSSVRRKIALGTAFSVVALIAGSTYHFLLAPKTLEKIDQAFESAWAQELTRALPFFSSAQDPPGPVNEPTHRIGPVVDEPVVELAASDLPTEEPNEVRSEDPIEPEPKPVRSVATEPSVSDSPGPRLDQGSKPVAEEPTPEASAPEPTPVDIQPPAESESDPPPSPPKPKTSTKVARQSDLAVDRHAQLLEARGQGQNAWSHLIFGRLQMFTGIEYFGLLFYFFCGGMCLLAVRRRLQLIDRVLLISALTVATVVLSGIRQLSWSNPRYIGSLLLIAAYFAGPAFASMERRWLSTRSRRAVALAVLLFPVVLVTSIRGAKIELTNPGTFYSEFRSFAWVRATADDPISAMTTFGHEYLGIRKTAAYFFADRDEQLRNAHDYFAAVLWTRDHLADDTRLLVFRDARFFYYGKHQASVWYSPVIRQYTYHSAKSPDVIWEYFSSLGFSHILVDTYSTRLPGYAGTLVGEMLDDERFARLVFEFGTARVYELVQ
ncbi:MAG: hypothetical protein MPN21_21265 [Thermoanaerobaculia bacterium]|nr:hypothetical protein [Thermoanaerobaculia bacterium]